MRPSAVAAAMAEASELQDVMTRTQARRLAVQQDFSADIAARQATNSTVRTMVDTRRARVAELNKATQQQQAHIHKAASEARPKKVAERRSSVFQLQLEVAEQRRFVRKNPLQQVGGEAQKNLATSRTGGEVFQTLRNNRNEVLDRIQTGRRDDVQVKLKGSRQKERAVLNDAQERTQNVRRRLASTYGGASPNAVSKGAGNK